MVNLLRALDLRWIVWKILDDREVEVKSSSFIHAFVRLDCEDKIQNIVRIRKFCSPRLALLELRKV